MKLALLGRIVGPLVELDVELVEVLVLIVDVELLDEVGDDKVADDEGLVVLVRLEELEDCDELDNDDEEVVESLDEEAATLELLEEIDDVDDCTDDELVATPFLYMLRRFGPPQYWFLSALQTMLHCV